MEMPNFITAKTKANFLIRGGIVMAGCELASPTFEQENARAQ